MAGFPDISGMLFGTPASSKTQETPGIYSRDQARQFANLAAMLMGFEIPDSFYGGGGTAGGGSSVYSGFLKSPSSGPITKPENRLKLGSYGLDTPTQAILDQAINASQGRFNALGIGASPSAQWNVAAAAAPTLADYRTRTIQQLLQMAGFGVPQVSQETTGATPGASSLIPGTTINFGGSGGK